MAKKRKEEGWRKYGYSFWVSFSVVAVSLGTLGTVFAGFSAYTIVFGKGGWFWLALLVFGLVSLAASVFCMRLLPDWAETVRTFRLLEQRFKGAMGASSVSQYIQADAERNRALMDSIELKQDSIGHALAKKIDRLQIESMAQTQRVDENLAKLTKSMVQLQKKLASMSDPLEVQRFRTEAKALMEKVEKAKGVSFHQMEDAEVLKSEEDVAGDVEDKGNDESTSEVGKTGQLKEAPVAKATEPLDSSEYF